METSNHWIEDWLSARAQSNKTRDNYTRAITLFSEFCKTRGKNFSSIVDDYRAARYSGAREEQMFLDQWNDLISAYTTFLKPKYAPLTQKFLLTVPKSFFTKWKISIDVELPRRACVEYHNRDLEKEQIKMILSKATQRDRVIFLMEAESGLRTNTIINLKYWQIKTDYEMGTVPMQILTPSSTIKDHVGDRWSFIGEDAEKELREYLKHRMPLKADDYVFAPEKPGLMKGEQFTEASLSTKFRRITQHLKMEKGTAFGKPGHYRMHGLRKYFFNNMRAPKEYRDFWMGHSISGSDENYITRNPEVHRKKYAQGYEQLRILEPATPAQLTEIAEKLQEKEREIQELQRQNQELAARLDKLAEPLETLRELNSIEGLSQKQEKNPLGIIIQYLKLQAAKGLNDEVQKLKEAKKEDREKDAGV